MQAFLQRELVKSRLQNRLATNPRSTRRTVIVATAAATAVAITVPAATATAAANTRLGC